MDTLDNKNLEKPYVNSIKIYDEQAVMTLKNVEDKLGTIANIFSSLSEHKVNIDLIIQNKGHNGFANIDFSFSQKYSKNAKEAIKALENSKLKFELYKDIVKIEIEGIGMKSHSDIASVIFSTMAKHNIDIIMITTSEIKISMIIKNECATFAKEVLNKGFEDAGYL